MALRFVLSVVCVLMLTGCGDDGEEGTQSTSPQPGTRADLEAYLTAYDQASCGRELRCEADTTEFASVEDCVAAVQADASVAITRTNRLDSVEAGTIAFYPTVGDEVIVMMEGSCDTSGLDILTKNSEAFEGKVAIGDPCRGHYACSDEGVSGLGPYCFDGCDGYFGDEAVGVNGVCVESSPIGTAACP